MFGAMLLRIDVTVAAGEVAGRQYMEENVSLSSLETDGSWVFFIIYQLRLAEEVDRRTDYC